MVVVGAGLGKTRGDTDWAHINKSKSCAKYRKAECVFFPYYSSFGNSCQIDIKFSPERIFLVDFPGLLLVDLLLLVAQGAPLEEEKKEKARS